MGGELKGAGGRRPNIVFVFADEWRAQSLGYAGDPNAHTPVIDALADESVNVTRAVAGAPVCCPYRASLLTGQYPLTHGVFINDVELAPDSPSIARQFSAAGYDTAYIGKWHVYGSPDGFYGRRAAFVPREYQMGFDYWKGFECNHDYNNSRYYFNDDPNPREWRGYDALAQSADAAQYIRNHAEEAPDRPFLLMLSWGPPHFPLHTAPEEYRAMYADRDIRLQPNVPPGHEERAVEDLRGYYAHIAALDDAMKTVLDAVDESGIRDDTIFVFTSDHGDMMQSQGIHMKLYPFEESVRVPFLLRWSGLPATAPSELPLPLDAPDILPTLQGLCGLPVADTTEGRDCSGKLRGERPVTEDDAAFLMMAAEFTHLLEYGMTAYRGLRTPRYTYVRNTEGPWLLYDNEADPFQMRNLVGKREHAALQAGLEQRLQARLDAMGDEFLDGRVYLERAGLTHYEEIKRPLKRLWKDPWQPNAAEE